VNTQVCGNSIREGTEECDDGNLEDGDDCLVSCRKPRCGDGVVYSSGTDHTLEQCDPGDPNWAPMCNASCRLTTYGSCNTCTALSSCPTNATNTCTPSCSFNSAACPTVPAPWSSACLGAACYIKCRNGVCPAGLVCARDQGTITPTGPIMLDLCVVNVPQ
jgi:cysteine-rich repeat protein